MAIDSEKVVSKQDSGKVDKSAGKEKKPEGGHDNTPLRPSSEPTYMVKITFHSASNLPVSDLGARSSDPFVLAQLNTGRPPRNPQDPYLRFRSHTIQQTLDPEWSSEWIVAGVPASGFQLKVRVMDEDPGDHDDQVGKVTVESGRLEESWKGINKQEFKMRKAGADLKSYALRWIRASMCKNVQLHARIIISVEVLGKTKEEIGKAYTVNNFWWIHYSPMIGRLTGTKANDAQGVEKFNFQANELQLRGPVPSELYHRYVEFKPFIKGMFKNAGLRGRILHKTLHHQHERLYNFDKMTKFGTLPDGPGDEMTLQFLKMAHFDQGGRIFTYVITLDGMFRFTETGKEFGIDMLSKHTMHSDVNIFIAWSGEFLIRRLSKPDKNANVPDQHTHPADDVPGGPPNDAPPQDPAHYELVIDNDSGTYRPDGQYLPVLKKFLKMNFPGLHIVTMDCTDKKLDKIKEEQKQVKDKEGDHRVFGQGPSSISSSLSSSDEEDLEERARGDKEYESTKTKGLDAVADPAGAIRGVFGSKGKVEREERETEDDQAVEQSEERAK